MNGPASAGPLCFLDSARAPLRARDRRPRRPPDPRDAVRRRRGGRARRLLRRARARLVAAAPEAPPREGPLRLPARARGAARARSALAVFLFTVYAGLAGTDGQSDNLAPTMVYVAFWVGVPFASLLFGNVFGVLSPWRALGRGDRLDRGRASATRCRSRWHYPERLGRHPGRGRLFGFAICELCWASATEPGPLAILMLLYFVAMLVGMSLYGVEAWTRNADAFGVLFRLIGSLAPLGRREDSGRLYLRVPFTGAAKLTPVTGHDRAADHLGRQHGVRRRQGGRAVQRPRPGPAALLQRPRPLARACRSSSRSSSGWRARSRSSALIWAVGMAGMKPPPERAVAHGARARLQPHADPDRRRLPRRPLLLAAGLQRPGPLAARQRPARRRLGPLRRRRGDDRLRRRRAPPASGTCRSARS